MPIDFNNPYDNQFEQTSQDRQKSAPKNRIISSKKRIPTGISGSSIGLQYEPFGGYKDVDVDLSFDSINDIEEYRARSQSGWKLLGNATMQGTTEAVLGGVEGLGYVLDFEELTNHEAQAEEGFDNWFSKGIREFKEGIQEDIFPIYQSRVAREGTLWEKLGDATYWASQGKTIGTTASLMIPSLGAANIAGKLGRIFRIGDTASDILKGISAAAFSRKAESTMEANQIFQQKYLENKNMGMSEEDARISAGKIAANVFKANAVMLPMDFAQYALLLKPFSGIAKGIETAKISKLGKIAENAFIQPASEAVEEFYQQVAQYEAINAEKEGISPFGTGFGGRLSDYIKEPEAQEAAFWGAAMGGLFGAVGPIARRVADMRDSFTAKKISATNLKDLDSFTKIDNKIEGELISRNLASGRLDKLTKDLEDFEASYKENENLTDTEKNQVSTKVAKIKENIVYVSNADQTLTSLSPIYAKNTRLRQSYSLTKLEDKFNNEQINTLSNRADLLKKGIVDPRDLSVLDNAKIKGLEESIKKVKLEKNLAPESKTKIIGEITTKINEQKDILANHIELAKQSNPTFKLEEYSSPVVEEYGDASYKLQNAIVYRDAILRPTLAKYEHITPEKAVEEETKIEEEIKIKAEEIKKEQGKNLVKNAASEKEILQPIVEEIDDLEDKAFLEGVTKQLELDLKMELPNYSGIPEESDLGDPLFDEIPEISPLGDPVEAELSEAVEYTKIPDLDVIYRSRLATASFIKDIRDLATKLEELNTKITRRLRLVKSIEGAQKVINDIYTSEWILIPEIESFFKGKLEEQKEKPIVVSTEINESPTIVDYNEESVVEGEISYITDENLNDPSNATAWEVVLYKDPDTNEFKIQYGEDGAPIFLDPSRYSKDFNWDYINNPNNALEGTEVRLEVLLDSDYSPNKVGIDDFIIMLVEYNNGERHEISPVLSASKANEKNYQVEYEKLKNLRTKVWDIVKNSKQKTGILDTGLTTIITIKHAGRINRSPKGETYSPLEISEGINTPIVLGIAHSMTNAKTGLIEIPNAPSGEYSTSGIKGYPSGAVYMMIPGANGVIIPIRAFTRKIEEFDTPKGNKYKRKIYSILNELNDKNFKAQMKALKEITHMDIKPTKNNTLFIINKGGKSYTFTKETLRSESFGKLLNDYVLQIDLKQINRGDYNQNVANDRLKFNIPPTKPIHSTRFNYSLDVTEDSLPKIVELKSNITPIVPSKSNTDPEVTITTDISEKVEINSTENVSMPINISEINDDFDLNIVFTTEIKSSEKTRLVDNTPYKFMNLNEAKNWLNERLGKIEIDGELKQFPVEDVDGLIEVISKGALAWGLARESSIVLSNIANAGTEYHEAFHIIFQLALDDSKKNIVMSEAKNRYKISDSEALEERLAEDFRTYVIERGSGKIEQNSIKKFFKSVYNWIRYKVFGTNVDQLFYRIDNKEFKNTVFRKDVSFTRASKYDISGLSPKQRMARTINIADSINLVITKLNEKNPQLDRREIITSVGLETILKYAYTTLKKEYIRIKDSLTPQQAAQWQIMINEFFLSPDPSLKGTVKLGRLGELALRRTSLTEGISIRLSDINVFKSIDPSNIEELDDLYEIDEEENALEGWQIDVTQVSMKDGAPKEIRKELSYIPVLRKDGSLDRDDIGRPKYLEFAPNFAFLLREFSDMESVEDMLEYLQVLVNTVKPELRGFYNKVSNDELLKTKLFQAFNSSHSTYKMLKEDKDAKDNRKSFIWFSSNRSGIQSMLIDSWRNKFGDSMFNELIDSKALATGDSIFKPETLVVFNKEWEAIKKYIQSKGFNDSSIRNIGSFLNKYGIDITEEELKQLNSIEINKRNTLLTNLYQPLDVIITRIGKGFNVFEDSSENKSLTKIANIIKSVRTELQEDSFRSTDNKAIYSHNVPNFITTQLSRLTGKRWEQFLDKYINTPFYSNQPWFNSLRDSSFRENFKYAVLDGYKPFEDNLGKTYEDMSPRELETVRINAFFNNNTNSEYTWYMVPPLSDAPSSVFIQAKRLTTEEVVEGLFNVALSEWARIKQVQQRKVSGAEKIKHFDDNGTNFILLKTLNRKKFLFENIEENKEEIKVEITRFLETAFNEDIKELTNLGVISKDKVDKIQTEYFSTGHSYPSNEEFLRAYFYNNVLANTQIIAMFPGDPAFYNPENGYVDFFKRNKEVWSPGKNLHVGAVYQLTEEQASKEGQRNIRVRETYNTITSNDIKLVSSMGKEIYDIFVKQGVNEKIATSIAKKWGYGENGVKTNVTDAQTWITLDRYREIAVGSSKWKKEHQDAFYDLKEGKSNPEDYSFSLDPIKPFMFTHREVEDLILPEQNKNSEFVLLPSIAFATKEKQVERPTEEDRENNYSRFTSPTLAKILDYMERKKVDSFKYDSAVKVGQTGVTSFENLEDAPIYQLSNRDFRIQQETPNHLTDSQAIIGTQIRYLIMADIASEATFTLDNKKISFRKLFDTYQDLISSDIVSGFSSVADKFKFNPEDNESYKKAIENVRKELIRELRERNMGEELEKAIDTYQGSDGKYRFKLPLFFPVQAKRIEYLIGSIFKNKVVKHKNFGGNAVQASGVGYTKFGNENIDFDDQLRMEIDNESGALKYVECYMPWWSAQVFKPLMDLNSNLDIKKLEEAGLDKLIGYRIPTEDKYSMLPLKIKGFLPRQSGGTIMLPAEITTLSGSDFDIDKLYILAPEFRIDREYDFNKLSEEMKDLGFSTNAGELGGLFAKLNKGENFSERELELFETIDNLQEVVKERVSKDPVIKKIKYNYSKNPNDQSQKARNNAKIDIMWAILTNPDTFQKWANPGNFDILKDPQNGLRAKINNLIEGERTQLGALVLPKTSRRVFELNMTGKKLIGFFANHNVNHSIVQYSDLELITPIQIAGRSRTSLHEQKAEDDSYISRNLAVWLAAVVDNAKEPVAADLNVTTFTVNILSTILRTGYSMETAIYFLNQPVLRELSKRLSLSGNAFQNYDDIYEEIINEIKVKIGEENLDKVIEHTDKTLIEDISGKESLEYNLRQLEILKEFYSIKEISDDLGKVIRATRGSNLKRPMTLSSNELFERTVGKLDTIATLKNISSVFENSPASYNFYKYSTIETDKVVGQWIPWNSFAFKSAKEAITKAMSKKKELTENQLDYFNYEIMTWAFSNYSFFNGDKAYKEGSTRSERDYITKSFPVDFEVFRNKHPELKEDFFLRHIEYKKPTRNKPFGSLSFSNAGKMNEIDRSEISRHWIDLLGSDKYGKFAESLVKYTYYTNGFHLNSQSFSHLIPTDFLYNLESEGMYLRDYLIGMEDEFQIYSYEAFKDQFFRNNGNNAAFVPDKSKGAKKVSNGVIISSNARDILSSNKDLPIEYISVDGDLYRYESSSPEGDLLYKRIEPLGIKNYVKEYSKLNPKLTSIFPSNKITVVKNNNKISTKRETTSVSKLLPEKVSYLSKQTDKSRSIYNQLGSKTKSENVVIDEVNGRKPAVESSVNLKTFTNYSGAAQGGDTVWENIGKEFGLGKQVNYRPEDLQKLIKEQLQEVENAYQQAVKDLGRKSLAANTFVGGLVRRDYLQAKAADTVFAISTIVQPNEKDPKGYVNKTNKPLVAGGTGYAVQMAINLNKPVYVFDQIKNKWFIWNNNTFLETITPILTKKFAGIGTREINENGKQAIKDVYEKSTQSSKPIVAYRTRGNNFLEAFEKDNAIGNPFSSVGYGMYKSNPLTTEGAVEEFIAWMIGEKHTDKLQDYRRAIINKIPKLKGKQILYYKDLGEPSHATALDYLINKYNWSQTSNITIAPNTNEIAIKNAIEALDGFIIGDEIPGDLDILPMDFEDIKGINKGVTKLDVKDLIDDYATYGSILSELGVSLQDLKDNKISRSKLSEILKRICNG